MISCSKMPVQVQHNIRTWKRVSQKQMQHFGHCQMIQKYIMTEGQNIIKNKQNLDYIMKWSVPKQRLMV